VHEYEHISLSFPKGRMDVLDEEVAGDKRIHMELEERIPRLKIFSIQSPARRCRINPFVIQNSLYAGLADASPEFEKLSRDP